MQFGFKRTALSSVGACGYTYLYITCKGLIEVKISEWIKTLQK